MTARLKRLDFGVWTDEHLVAGEDWRAGIDQAIRDFVALVVVMSPTAKASEYVTYEWAFAWGVGVKVIPIMIEFTDFHPLLEAIQHFNFINSASREWDKLFELLKSVAESPNLRRSIAPRGLPPIIQSAVDDLDGVNEETRRRAVNILAEANHPAARQAIVGALNHYLPDVRLAAANAFQAIEDAAAVPGLIGALRDENSDVRCAAAAALVTNKSTEATTALAESLRHKDQRLRKDRRRRSGQSGNRSRCRA